MLSEIVEKTVRDHRLLEIGDRVLIAYSGGLDSTALVAVFLELRKKWALHVFLGHFNHRLRPGADEDERFVRKIARQHDLPLFAASKDVRAFASRKRLNLEEAGRILRYDFLEKTARKIGGAKIATGHTMNDQAETFLMRLMRGSGLKGLGSISSIVGGRIIRPLLSAERKDIADYVEKKGWAFREDESNLDRRFTRNKIRLDLIPYIQENFETNIVQRIGRLVDILQEENRILEDRASGEAEKTIISEGNKIRLDSNILRILPKGLARRIVLEFIRRLKGDLRGISFEDVDSLLSLEEGKCLQLTDRLLLKKEKGFIFCRPEPPDPPFYSVEWDGSAPLPLDKLGLTVTAERTQRPPSFDFDDNAMAYFDGSTVSFPLHVRNRREGDRYKPLGAPGHKKLKEIMRAKSVPLPEREEKPVFLAEKKIIWVLGLPVAEECRISSGTKEVLILRVARKDQR